MPLRSDIKKVLVIGSGPIIIGQAAEFDYAGTQACRALKQEGLEVVLINSNPATIMTDKAMADKVYIEPLTLDVVKRIIQIEKPDSLLSTMGGQTGLTLSMQLAEEGFLEAHGVKLLGADPLTIHKAEDRQAFKDTMEKINSDNAFTLSTGDMIFICDNVKKRIPGSSMYTTYTDDNGNTTGEDFKGENLITGSIKGVAENRTPTVYFLSGHGEKSLDSYTRFTTNLTNYNYAAKELNLSEADAVPEDAALVLVAAPTKDITDAESEKLNAYLDNGGNISLLMSPNGGSFVYTNLEKIMKDYGFYMDYDRVYETNNNYHISGDAYTIQCELNELEDDSEATDLTSALVDQGLYTFMPESRSFRYNDEGGKYTIAPLITSYDSAVGEPYGGTSDDPEEESGQLLLAAHSTSVGRNDSKMVVFGNAEFIDDEHVSDDTVIVPVYLFLSTISWMYDSDINMDIATKSTTNDYISLQDSGFAQRLMVVLTVVPIAIMAVGVGGWIKRRNS